jgi:hypothetical protein
VTWSTSQRTGFHRHGRTAPSRPRDRRAGASGAGTAVTTQARADRPRRVRREKAKRHAQQSRWFSIEASGVGSWARTGRRDRVGQCVWLRLRSGRRRGEDVNGGGTVRTNMHSVQGDTSKAPKGLRGQFQDIWAQSKKAVVFPTHDGVEAVELSDRIIVLQPGREIFEGRPAPMDALTPTVAAQAPAGPATDDRAGAGVTCAEGLPSGASSARTRHSSDRKHQVRRHGSSNQRLSRLPRHTLRRRPCRWHGSRVEGGGPSMDSTWHRSVPHRVGPVAGGRGVRD